MWSLSKDILKRDYRKSGFFFTSSMFKIKQRPLRHQYKFKNNKERPKKFSQNSWNFQLLRSAWAFLATSHCEVYLNFRKIKS